MSTLTSMRTLVQTRVRDAAGKLSDTDYNRAITAALTEYTRDRPRVIFVEVPGSGSFDYAVADWGVAGSDIAATTRWDAGFSALLEVVYPHVAGSRQHPVLDPDLYGVVNLPAGPTLRFAASTPAVGQVVLVSFTRRHEIAENWSTVPTSDEEAVADLAASYALKYLASYYAQATDSSIGADVADHPGRSQTYLTLSRDYREAYDLHMGRGASFSASGVAKVTGPPAAGVIVDLDREPSSGGSYFFHDRLRT